MPRGPLGKVCRKCGEYLLQKYLVKLHRKTSASQDLCKFCRDQEKLEHRINNGEIWKEQGESSLADIEDRRVQAVAASVRPTLAKAAKKKAVAKGRKIAARPKNPGILELPCTYDPHPKARMFHESSARFRTICAGVRGGKSTAGNFEIAQDALETPRGMFWVVAPTYKLLNIEERIFRSFFDHINEKVFDYEKKERRYIFPSKSIVEFVSAEWPDQLRGSGLNGGYIAEAAFLREEAARIIRTRVSDTGGRLWVASSPKGKNWMHRWFMRGRSDDPRWADYESFHWESRDNPKFPEDEWEAAKAELPEDFFAQEYMAVFLDDVAGVFRGVDAIVRQGELGVAQPGFVMGIDLAKSRDFTVFIVMDAKGQVVDYLRMNEIRWKLQREEAVRYARKWSAQVWIDSTGVGDPICEELRNELGEERVEGIKFTNDNKRQMIQALQSAIEHKQISLPQEEVLIDELKWFEYKRTGAGNVRYEAPSGFSDDCVIALALANWGRLRSGISGDPVIIDAGGNENRVDLGMESSRSAVFGRRRQRSFWGGKPRRRLFNY